MRPLDGSVVEGESQAHIPEEASPGAGPFRGIAEEAELPVDLIDLDLDTEQPEASEPKYQLFTQAEVCRALKIPPSVTKRLTEAKIEDDSSLFWLGITPSDASTLYCDYHGLHAISSQLPAPRDMVSVSEVASSSGNELQEVITYAQRYRKTNPLDIRPHSLREGLTELFVTSEMAIQINDAIERRAKKEAKKEHEELDIEFKRFAQEMREGTTLDAQDFQKLISLLPENATDLLFHFRPDFRHLPADEVKSFLADYLGEFVVIKGQISIDAIEVSKEFLSDPDIKKALTEAIKRDCLATYHRTHRADPGIDEFSVIADYLAEFENQTRDLESVELKEVIKDLENYYLSVFFDYDSPEQIIEGLQNTRPFPDLNQRVNIKDICDKHRMLIADDPGLGKSASAILAKEHLTKTAGLGLALIIAPSQVVEKNIWQDYLSDQVDENGKQVGYFRPGEAPRVLVYRNPESLVGVSKDDYDYIIISQESLREDNIAALKAIGFDMLVVDEAHKLKNINEGMRANCLIELADFIEQRTDSYTVLLTATPAPNKVSDIAMILRLLYPKRLGRYTGKELALMMINGDVRDLRSLLLPKMQMKALEDSIDMPKAEEHIHYVQLSEKEVQLIKIQTENDEIEFSTKIIAMRQTLLNPAILELEPPIKPSKAEYLDGLINSELESDKRKVLVFINNFTDRTLAGDSIITDFLDLPDDVEVMTIHGDVQKPNRAAIQKEFQHSSGRVLLVVSGQTSDVGVDFSAADCVIFYNEGWTLSEKKQEIGRANRPGRLTALSVHTLIAAGTIEEGIHEYIKRKDKAIRKLMHGIPLSELDQRMLVMEEEDRSDSAPDVNPEIANYYMSATQRINRLFGSVKQAGESAFVQMKSKNGRQYALSYKELTGRSYQANMSRLSATIIDQLVAKKAIDPKQVRILDLGSGPEMLRRHISSRLSERVISLDIIEDHFDGTAGRPNAQASVVHTPIASSSADVVSMGLVLDSTKYLPSRWQAADKSRQNDENLERLAALAEMNRVLKTGGTAVITQIYSLDFADNSSFERLVTRMGFRVIRDSSGLVYSNAELRGRVVTLEKQRDCPTDLATLVEHVGKDNLGGLKFAEREARVKDPKRIDLSYKLDHGAVITPMFNEEDQVILNEEAEILNIMQGLLRHFKQVSSIPPEEIATNGLSRIKLRGRYILFRHLQRSGGAVLIKQ